MTTNYTINTSDNTYLTTIYQSENNGIGNLSTPLQIHDISFDPSNPGLYIAGDVTARFTDGFMFNIINSAAYNGSYIVNGIAYTELSPDEIHRISFIPISPAITVSGLTVTNIETVTIAVDPTINTRYWITWTLHGNYEANIHINQAIRFQNIIFNGNITSSDAIVERVMGGPIGTSVTIIETHMDNLPSMPTISLLPNSWILYPSTSIHAPFGAIQYSNKASSSLQLVGPGVSSYNTTTTWGHVIQNNYIHMLENFHNSLPPTSPMIGQLWHKSGTTLHMFDASSINSYNVVGVSTNAFYISGDVTTSPHFANGKTVYFYNNIGYGINGPLTSSSYVISSTSFANGQTTLIVQDSISTTANISSLIIDKHFTILTKNPINNTITVLGDQTTYFVTGYVFYIPGDKLSAHTVSSTPSIYDSDANSTLVHLTSTLSDPLLHHDQAVTYVPSYGTLCSSDSWFGLVTERMPVNGIIDMNSYHVTNLAYPINDTDAANKQYVADYATLGAGLIRNTQIPPEIIIDNYATGGLFNTLDGITLSTSPLAQLSIKLNGGSLVLSSNGLSLPLSGAVAGTYTKFTVNTYGIVTAAVQASLMDMSNVFTGDLTTTSTTQVWLSRINPLLYRTVEYTIQAYSGSDYQATKILAIHDGTTVSSVEYGTINIGSTLATFDIIIQNSYIELMVTPTTATSTTFKSVGVAIPL